MAALDGIDEARALQQREYLLEVDLRDAELLRDTDDRDRLARSVIAGQVRHGRKPVAAFSRNLHRYSLIPNNHIENICHSCMLYHIRNTGKSQSLLTRR